MSGGQSVLFESIVAGLLVWEFAGLAFRRVPTITEVVERFPIGWRWVVIIAVAALLVDHFILKVFF